MEKTEKEQLSPPLSLPTFTFTLSASTRGNHLLLTLMGTQWLFRYISNPNFKRFIYLKFQVLVSLRSPLVKVGFQVVDSHVEVEGDKIIMATQEVLEVWVEAGNIIAPLGCMRERFIA